MWVFSWQRDKVGVCIWEWEAPPPLRAVQVGWGSRPERWERQRTSKLASGRRWASKGY